jgi:xylulokinase
MLYSFTGISTAGFNVRWFRDQYGQEELENQRKTGNSAYKQLDKKADTIPVGGGDLIFLPHMMVGERAPYWDEHIRGAFLGLTVYHSKAHMYRSILEGVTYAMRYSIDAAREAGFKINRATLVDGGASSPLWRQIIADVTEIEFQYIPDTLGAPMGDAILAGLGTGEITDYKIIEDWIGEKISTKPIAENVKKYNKYYLLYSDAVEKLSPFFARF